MVKKALITGASGGLGKAIAERLKQEDFGLFLHSREIADLSDKNGVGELLKKSGTDFDIFIHSVSAPIEHNLAEEKSWNDFEKHLNLQLKSFFLIAQKLLPHMKAKGWGRIIPIATEYTEGVPPTQISDYVSAKYAMLGLARCIAEEYKKFGITCNAVSPGTMETNLTSNLPRKLKEIISSEYKSGKLIEPKDVAEKVAWLCSNEAKNINGENIIIV